MTDIDEAFLARLEQLADAATPGPWKKLHGDERGGTPHRCDCAQVWVPDKPVAYCNTNDTNDDDYAVFVTPEERNANALFIAATREAVPALIAEVRRLRALVDLQGVVKERTK